MKIRSMLHNFLFLVCCTCNSIAYAQSGGLSKVSGLLNKVSSALSAISITVVTIAIIWAGYKFLFKNADMRECLTILGGGLLIGGAAELANFLLS